MKTAWTAPLMGAVAAALGACGGRVTDDRPNATGGTSSEPDGGAGAGRGGAAGQGGSGGEQSGSASSGGSSGAPGTSAGGTGGTHTDLPFASEKLLSLSDAKLKQVCVEEAERADPCMARALEADNPTECEATYATCRERAQNDPRASCENLEPIDCDVTVEQFFACIDAWNETQTCDNAGFLIESPAACGPLKECTAFEQEFRQIGRGRLCDSANAPLNPDNGDGIYGLDAECYTVPNRFVALGHSLAACEQQGACAPHLLADHIREHYSPGLEYENLASTGGIGGFDNLIRQADLAGPTTGHLVVFVYSLPDDLEADMLTSEELSGWRQQLEVIWESLRESVTDGATFLLNTQYSPSDQCPDSANFFGNSSLSHADEDGLQRLNQALFIDLGMERPDTVTIDQYPDWLGHGWNAGIEGCPHCYRDNTIWQADPVHPNAAGQRHIFEKWRLAVDRMYGGSCAP